MKNLHELIKNTKENYRNNSQQTDIELSDEFKTVFASYLRNNGQDVSFNETTAVIKSSGNLLIYAPNQWFMIASYVTDFVKELIIYRKFVDLMLSKMEMNSKDKKNYITKLKENATEDDLSNLEILYNKALVNYTDKENVNKEYIIKFLTDYSWWSGSKTIDRGDYYVSPVLNLLGLVNASQSYVADIAYFFACDSNLTDIVKNDLLATSVNRANRNKREYTLPDVSRKKGGQNLIVYGAPGTGKSRSLEDLLVSGIWEDKKYENFISSYNRVIFHPEYTYFDFVGSYKPVPIYKKTDDSFINKIDNGENNLEPYIDYQFVPGPFVCTLVSAYLDPVNMYTLLIEEINRANAAAVFGEIFQLLDRTNDGSSEYTYTPSRELMSYLIGIDGMEQYVSMGIKIPSNMNIVATMNSADQGVNFIDSAFKRRWNYKYKRIDIGNAVHKEALIYYGSISITWGTFITALNDKLIKSQVDEDRLIGPYFIKPDELNTSYATDKLLLYLWDDILRHKRTHFFAGNIRTFYELTEKFEKEDVLGILTYLNSEKTDNHEDYDEDYDIEEFE